MWRRLGPKLLAVGIISELDEPGFCTLCETYARWLELIRLGHRSHLRADNPYYARADKVQDALRRMLVEFGMTPSSRVRLSATTNLPSSADELRTFLADGDAPQMRIAT